MRAPPRVSRAAFRLHRWLSVCPDRPFRLFGNAVRLDLRGQRMFSRGGQPGQQDAPCEGMTAGRCSWRAPCLQLDRPCPDCRNVHEGPARNGVAGLCVCVLFCFGLALPNATALALAPFFPERRQRVRAARQRSDDRRRCLHGHGELPVQQGTRPPCR